MAYRVGVDLGTTYTAASLWRAGDRRPEIVQLGTEQAAMPSVVFVDASGEVLTGDAAAHRAGGDPTRVARRYKSMLGDPAPILLGGSPWSAAALMARVLADVLAEVARQEDGPPDEVTLTHPAGWGPYRLEHFREVPRLAGVSAPVGFVAEPVAAARQYAATDHVPPGALLAIYDLGGGTFDASVVAVGEGGTAEVIGPPEGISNVGGAVFDDAVLQHVRTNAPQLFEGLDDNDPVAGAALAELRRACRVAKEALSEDHHATIVAAMPAGVRQIRINRDELEQAIGPQIDQTIAALTRAIEAAGRSVADIDRVLLIGGASRMPIVSTSLASTLGRPVALDANPKHVVALGAARMGGALDQPVAAPTPLPEPEPAPVPVLQPLAEPVPVPVPVPEARTAPPPLSSPPAPPPDSLELPPAAASSGAGWRRPAVAAAVVAVVVGAAFAVTTLGGGGDDGTDGDDDGSDQESTTAVELTAVAGAGAGDAGDGAAAVDVAIGHPGGITVHPDGRILFAEYGANRIRAITPDGTLETVAGTGVGGDAGDGGPATEAQLRGPTDVVLLGDGTLLVTDSGNDRIRAIDDDGTITTLAEIAGPTDADILPDGRVVVAESGENRVVIVDAEGTVTPFAGTGEAGAAGDGGTATAAQLNGATGVAAHPDGRIFISDTGNNQIRAVDEAGTITTVAGTQGALSSPSGLAIDAQGRILVADLGNARVAVLDSGAVTALAVDAGEIQLVAPAGVAVDPDGRVLVSDFSEHRVVAVSEDGSVEALAGSGGPGDGGEAVDAQLSQPGAVALHPDLGILIADTANNRIRAVDGEGRISTVSASVSQPRGVAVDGDGQILVTTGASVVAVDQDDGSTTTVADGFTAPTGIAVIPDDGRILVTDPGAGTVTLIETDGTTSVVVDGLTAPTGIAVHPDGVAVVTDPTAGTITVIEPDQTFVTSPVDEIAAPTDLAVHPDGRLLVADPAAGTISAVDRDGAATTLVDGLDGPAGLAVESDGTVIVCERDGNRVVAFDA